MFIKIQMPYGTSTQKKKELMSELTNTAAQIMDIPAENISIMIDDRFDYDNWMMGGKQDNLLASLKEALNFSPDATYSEDDIEIENGLDKIKRNEEISKIIAQLKGCKDIKEDEEIKKLIEEEEIAEILNKETHDKAFDMEVITEVVAQTVDEMVRTSKILADKMSEALKKYSEK